MDWNHIQYQQERYADLLREAERERLIRGARAADGRSVSLYDVSLAWLGRQLVAWGRRLQARHSAPETYGNVVQLYRIDFRRTMPAGHELAGSASHSGPKGRSGNGHRSSWITDELAGEQVSRGQVA